MCKFVDSTRTPRLCTVKSLSNGDTLGPANLSTVERLSTLRR